MQRGRQYAEIPALVAVAATVLAIGAVGIAAMAHRMVDLDSISYAGHRLRGRLCAAPGGRFPAGAAAGRRAPSLGRRKVPHSLRESAYVAFVQYQVPPDIAAGF